MSAENLCCPLTWKEGFSKGKCVFSSFVCGMVELAQPNLLFLTLRPVACMCMGTGPAGKEFLALTSGKSLMFPSCSQLTDVLHLHQLDQQ